MQLLMVKNLSQISGLEQLVDDSQTNSLAVMLDYLNNELLNDNDTLIEATDRLYQRIEAEGLEVISHHQGHPGNLALPRKQELIGTINRYRGLHIRSDKTE